MKPIFTVHAGEYLVATQIEMEKEFKNVSVWLPSKDDGIDLLLTDKDHKKTASLQVKFSKDFNTHVKEHIRPNIRGTGWWKLSKKGIEKSKADFWVFILYSFDKKSNDFIIIEPKKLLKIFTNLNRQKEIIHCYITVTKEKAVFETRGIPTKEMQLLYDNKYKNSQRDLKQYHNNWEPILNKLNRI